MKRALFLVTVVMATAVQLLPAAPAEAASGCQTFPSTPFWKDPKYELVMATNIAACDRQMLVVRSEVELYVWSERNAQWTQLSSGDASMSDTTYVRSEAFTSCKSMGAGTHFRSRGRATGVWDYSYTSVDGWKWSTYYKTFDCSELRAIQPA